MEDSYARATTCPANFMLDIFAVQNAGSISLISFQIEQLMK